MDAGEPSRRYCRCGTRLARDNAGSQCAACTRRARALVAAAPEVPADFWQTDQLRDALEAWHMGRVITAYRVHAFHSPPLSQAVIAGWMGLTQAQLSRIEAGEPITDLTKLIRWARALRIPEELLWFRLPPRSGEVMPNRPDSFGPADPLLHLESLRRRAEGHLTTGAPTAATIEDWQRVVSDHGRATRYLPASVQLEDLAADFSAVQHALATRQPSSTTRQLTHITAQLAGLISLSLIKMGHRSPARAWGRTARLAADESGDAALSSWVRAQDAYTYYYGGAVREAVAAAQEAQAIAGRTPCVGAVLAAALQARAHAVLGQKVETDAALRKAEAILAALQPDDVTESAFGYNEAQLRFHEGNALTHLHDRRRVWEATDRALTLYPSSNYLDRTLIELDRADCLIHDGEVAEGVAHVARTLMELPPQRRDGLILQRARGLAKATSPGHHALPTVRQLYDVLELPARNVGGGA
ncbi:helix-turn-helix transcriptional regulator [Pseudofrankia sp. BMG5.37]|uniref:helix-turn-helix domain-containing protein n=1 Tax=Pseudofrankia sp. BMG5.37 TaxID=3050035 RepID=UPI002893A7B7|nr:helix-turn-helix transcriptional regulator [Pseudofrankia sp. BMG5.37]MDT3438267.1 helix-turn-helix transcriptional regulator [Pseudofrankia sp. BMG5.37]